MARSMGLPTALTHEMISALVASGWYEKNSQGAVLLTEQGRERGRELIRAHRL